MIELIAGITGFCIFTFVLVHLFRTVEAKCNGLRMFEAEEGDDRIMEESQEEIFTSQEAIAIAAGLYEVADAIRGVGESIRECARVMGAEVGEEVHEEVYLDGSRR